MSRYPISLIRLPHVRLGAALLLILGAACREDVQVPSAPDNPLPAEPLDDPAGAPAEPVDDGVADAILDTRSNRPGIVFGSVSMPNSFLDNVHTGWLTGGPLVPSNILSWLSGARAKGGRVVIKLCKGKDSFVKNADGTFSLTKWKALVGSYKNVKLDPYISDGTIVGHYLIDEPQRASRWGGKVISQATLEEMAKYSKSLWPQMSTLVRVVPSWLASSSINYKYLDAGWTQYAARFGDAKKWVSSEAVAASRKGLGLVVGMNVIDGGDGSSKIRGASAGKWSMSATEIRDHGTALLSEARACAFFNSTHDPDYYERSDIRSAMAEVSAKAKAHAKTSCRQ